MKLALRTIGPFVAESHSPSMYLVRAILDCAKWVFGLFDDANRQGPSRRSALQPLYDHELRSLQIFSH
jgi:hypothetical protein